MGIGDFSFSIDAAAASPKAALRYIARPFQARAVGQETLILTADGEATVRAPLFYAQMLAQCGSFQTLQEHTHSIRTQFGLPPEQSTALQQGLNGLVDRGLLQDEQSVYASLCQTQADGEVDRSAPRTLCIRTCDRPDDLHRLLNSLARRAGGTGLERVLVLDDSRCSQSMAKTADLLADSDIAPQLELVHIDRSRRARLTDMLTDQAGLRPGQLQWLIEGAANDPAASYGAGLNLALLLTAGERFLMVDDDALLDAFALETPRDQLSLRAAHDFSVRFPEPPTTETSRFPALEVNPIQAHGELLGRSVGQVMSGRGLQDGHLLRHLSPQMIHDFNARPRIRLTTNGTLGDSGTGSMLWLYSLPATALRPWLEDPAAYQRLAFGRRVARSTVETQIASSVALMTTTLTGVDNRELLLPVPARGRGEDLVFGAGIRYLYPGTPCAALPWMLPHRPESHRNWAREDLTRRQGVNLAGYISERIEDLAETAVPAAIDARVDLLAGWMSSLGRMDDSECIADLRRHLLDRRARTAAAVSKTLAELNPPDWLRHDFESVISGHMHIDSAETARMAEIAPAIQRFMTGYSEALPQWVRAWQHVAERGSRKLLDETA